MQLDAVYFNEISIFDRYKIINRRSFLRENVNTKFLLF